MVLLLIAIGVLIGGLAGLSAGIIITLAALDAIDE